MQGHPFDMSRSCTEMNRNRGKGASNIKSGTLPVIPAIHIANCIRETIVQTEGIRMSDQTEPQSITKVSWISPLYMGFDRLSSRSETSIWSAQDLTGDQTDAGHTAQALDLARPATKSTSLTTLLKYPLSRSTLKRPRAPMATFFIDSKNHALAAGRSPTSLSDTAAVVSAPNGPGVCLHQRGSLSRRRNISVPELKGRAEASPKISYEDSFVDSPTIPGRPPMRRAHSDINGHERSSSVPGSWRENPFGEAILSAVAGPQCSYSPGKLRPYHSAMTADVNDYHLSRPLSPIFSPAPVTPMTAVLRSPSFNPLDSPAGYSCLELSPSYFPETVLPETPPPVPPKHRPGELASPIAANTMAKRIPYRTTHFRSKSSSPNLHQTSLCSAQAVQPPTRPAPSPPPSGSAIIQKIEQELSPHRALPQVPEGSISSVSLSIIDRPRPKKLSLKKQRSAPALPNMSMDIPPFDAKLAAALAISEESQVTEESVPSGVKAVDAVLVMPLFERDSIKKQAVCQAEQFEILSLKIATRLSKEVRALDERCAYLRKTYKSLRASRQKLHNRMITYLRSDSLTFSKERLIKQQEALIELDLSIDDWISKLERAENRRLRLRQKLLEHIGASLLLSTPPRAVDHLATLVTPPCSPQKNADIDSPKIPIDRKDVESIRIYADNQVLSLFNDIEKMMCEAC